MAAAVASAADWPSFRGGSHHAGVAGETLSMPLKLAWSHQARHAPSPAFRGGLAPSRRGTRVESITYDYVFHPVIAAGRLYFGSPIEEAVFCLDARTGEPEWVFHADGAIRFAPTLWQGRVLFGSDDGHVYCLEGASGRLVWKFRAAPSARRCIGNGRIISEHPVRTEVAIADGVAYFGAGLFPPLGTFLYAVEAESGKPVWKRQIPYSPHGQILVDGDLLFVATGRTCPAEFQRSDGAPMVDRPDARRALGGGFVGKINRMVVWGPDESGVTFFRVSKHPIADRRPPSRSATVAGRVTGLRALAAVAGERLHLVRAEQILAVDWEAFRVAASRNVELKRRPWDKKASLRYGASVYGIGSSGAPVFEDHILLREIEQAKTWSVANDDRLCAAILAGGNLIAGGPGKVVILDGKTGKRLWAHAVEGEALGLAAADGALFASTDKGRIYCFRANVSGEARRHAPEVAAPVSDDRVCIEAAETALEHAGARKGFCLVLGLVDGRLAREIAKRSELFVVALDSDPTRVQRVREGLARSGLYGKRVVVYHVPEDEPPFLDYFANLVVSEACLAEGRAPYAPRAVVRLLQPYGGTIVLGSRKGTVATDAFPAEHLTAWRAVKGTSGTAWHVARRRALPGAGEWTHMYANPANTLCSGDRLVGTEHRLQWLGPPGAEDVVERHALAHPPLFKDGKLFIAGLRDTVRAVDAYNGTLLWKVTVPGSTRMEMSHSAGFMAAGEDALFVASGEEAWKLDAATGKVAGKLRVPRDGEDWGYVGTVGSRLLGTSQDKPANQFSTGQGKGFGQRGYRVLVSARDLHSRPTVSRSFFVYDIPQGNLLWAYDRGSVILNPAIAVGDGTVWLVESRNPQADPQGTGTAATADFFARDAALVTLDLHTGTEQWRTPLGPLSDKPSDKHEHIAYLSYRDGHLLLTRTGHLDGKLAYVIRRLDARDGSEEWTQTIRTRHKVFAPLNYGKNGQQSRPVIVGDSLFVLGLALDAMYRLDWNTGAVKEDGDLHRWWSSSKTCAVPTASASALYFRRNSCQMYDITSGKAIDLTQVTRPGCWMSIIAAGGLVLMPEASSGCTCGFALQTSVVLAPPRP